MLIKKQVFTPKYLPIPLSPPQSNSMRRPSDPESDATSSTPSKQQEAFRYLEASLRLFVIPLTVASIWVMARNKQASDVYGKVEFSNISGLKYLVWINALSAGYALASVVISFIGCLNSDWIFFALDQVAAYLMVTSGSAVAELLYLAQEGDQGVSWSEVCSYYGRFCNKIRVSLAMHFLALVCFIALSLISAYRVFSKFEAPCVITTSKEVVEHEQGD